MKKLSLVLAVAGCGLASCKQDLEAPETKQTKPPGLAAQAVGPASRDVYKWPFSKTSIWNMPIHNNAQYVDAKLAYTWIAEDEEPIVLTPTAPLTDVYKNGWNSADRCSNLSGLLTRLPIPAGLVMNAGGTPNQSAAILKPDGEHVYQCQPFHRCVAGGPAYAAWAKNHGAWANDPTRDGEGCIGIYGEGIAGGHGGSALSSLGGSIRLNELVPGGVIRHALKILLNSPQIAYNNDGTPGYRWPALQADSYAANNYKGGVSALEMGALLALPPNFDVNTLASGPAKIIAQALKDYGAYLCDDTARDCMAFSTAWEPEGSVRAQFERQWGFAFITNWPVVPGTANSSAWLADLNTIARNLKVVSNNSASTIGGGPTTDFTNRRAPMAPDFGSAAAANVLANPSFDAEGYTQTPTGWSEYGNVAASYGETNGGGHTGAAHATHWATTAYAVYTSQSKAGIANGTYTAKAWVKSSGGQTQAYMYVKNFGGPERTVNIPASPSWTQITIPDIAVTNGQFELGFYSNAAAYQYLFIDDVELSK